MTNSIDRCNRTNSDADQPVAVLLGTTEMSLATARSLARRGIDVVSINLKPSRPPAGYSRHLRVIRGPTGGDPATLLEFLMRLGPTFRTKPVLMPMQDDAVLLIHEHASTLDRCYRSYVWSSPVLRQIASKTSLAAVASTYGLPVPPGLAVATFSDLQNARCPPPFPCIVKPEFTNDWSSHEAVAHDLKGKAIRCDYIDQLKDVLTRVELCRSRVVVQQFIEGHDCDHISYAAFVGPDGRIWGDIVAQKLRLHPPRIGIGCHVASIPQPDVAELGREIAAKLGFRGFASFQFKRERRTGRLFLLEVNLRFPIWLGLPISCGVDFPHFYYAASIGRSLEQSVTAATGRTWTNAIQDLRSMRFYTREGTWTWPQWLRSTTRSASTFMYFEWSDPVPAFVASLRWLRELFAFGRDNHWVPDLTNGASTHSNGAARSSITATLPASDAPLR
jgi:D-aspartate ligase